MAPGNPQRRLKGYLGGRIVVLLALLALVGVFGVRRAAFPISYLWFSGLTAAAFGFTAVSALALRRGFRSNGWVKLQPAWDVGYATALVYFSGGTFSPLTTLYPLTIIGGATLLYRRGALVAATLSSLSYGLLVDLHVYGLLHPLHVALAEATPAKALPHLLLHVVAFYALALLSGHLAEELRRTGARLEVAEAEVLDLEHLKDSILLSLGSGLVALDPRGREMFHNRAAEDLLSRAGIRIGQGMELAGVFDLDGASRREVLLPGGQLVLGYSVAPLFDRGGTRRGSILIFQDLTQVKRLEEDLRRTDRLAAVGRLAAGLAHEIRNPLASLSGSVEVLRHSAPPDPEDAHLLEIVLRETERLNRLVTNFLHYARPGKGEREPFSLRELVADTGFFFSQGEGRSGFRLENLVPEGLALVADRAQVEQVLLNLFRNSVEAAPEGVTVRVGAARAGASVTVTVEDDGPGIPGEIASRIFEPFFTGREGGTGLGLATVHRIVENHGGTVALESGHPPGAAFRLMFPAS